MGGSPCTFSGASHLLTAAFFCCFSPLHCALSTSNSRSPPSNPSFTARAASLLSLTTDSRAERIAAGPASLRSLLTASRLCSAAVSLRACAPALPSSWLSFIWRPRAACSFAICSRR